MKVGHASLSGYGRCPWVEKERSRIAPFWAVPDCILEPCTCKYVPEHVCSSSLAFEVAVVEHVACSNSRLVVGMYGSCALADIAFFAACSLAT
jgi:hypothetical protein